MRHANTYADIPDLSTPARLSPLVQATLVVGTLDLASCGLYWAFRNVPIWRVAQGSASLLLGPKAYSLGVSGVLFGLVVLYTMAALSVAGFGYISERYPALLRAPLRWGAAYGALLYTLLWVLIPLAIDPTWHIVHYDWMFTLLLIHMFLIGVPCALFAHWGQSPH
ncbi:hypothetical protein [Lysobacter sp. CFH 32150]|uniref:hypothetical protein n=1 Tax=Lysobacter sp. CFH 32150 TaxID=2927128 RepID=UPI001FA72D65|nr:hypothetical protein [Lysobacter sp. CFH 32150]MCI4567881.1 hypothetical protein [Lysobacter sp. CFH 32150]